MVAGNVKVRRRKAEGSTDGRAKVKTGCVTCRIRKVKCDEHKPFCQKCVNTGRTCDGYESLFRSFTSQPTNHANTGSSKSDVGPQLTRPAVIEIVAQDIEQLNRYFSTKTIFDVRLSCDDEARQILEASLVDPHLRHAVLSLRVLREDLETFGDGPPSVAQQTPGNHYGLQQYSKALGGLASSLSSPGSKELNSALLCCQIFISIEQVRKNYTAMAQHMIRGLRIMHDYRPRPGFIAANKLMPAHHDQMPLLDVFIIKLFAAPCKFAEPLTEIVANETTLSVCPITPHQQPAGSRDSRRIVPNMRTELTKIATSTLELLDKVSQVESVGIALQLLSDKTALLVSLESWLLDLEIVRTETGPPGREPISVSFLRLFHLILKIILLGALDFSLDFYTELQTETDRLQHVADSLSDRVSDYRVCNGTSNARRKRFTAC